MPMEKGRIIKAVSGFYTVDLGGKTVTVKARGKLRREEKTPLVGDEVSLEGGMLGESLPLRGHPGHGALSHRPHHGHCRKPGCAGADRGQ